ncbi:MAG: VTT domain-containing protein [Mariprofundaceae bacterium]
MDLEFAKQLIEQYGYWAVFISTVIEGEIVVLAAAAFTASGLLQSHWVIAAAALGAFVGHILFFAIGRWKGMQLIESLPFLRRHYPKANLVMDKYANWSVFVFQYLYGMRLISAILFGCSTISLVRFLFLQLINCIIWATLAFFAGHMIGIVAMKLFEMIGLYGLLAVLAALALSILLVYHRYGHHHVQAFLSSGRDAGKEQTDAVEGRHFMLEQLDYHTQLAIRSRQPLSLLLLKLAPQKQSHNSENLDAIARETCRFLRLVDIPARFSRDTFAIVAPDTDSAGARQAIKRLLAHLAQHDLTGNASHLSVGIAEWQADMSAGKMLDQAYRDLSPALASNQA